MIKTIILVRHGKACSLDAFDKDIDRVLTERGVNDGYKVADILVSEKLDPDIIYASPAARASQTALIMARGMDIGSAIVQINDKLYHCSGKGILDIIVQAPQQANIIMVVAHNPSISDLAYQLTRGQVSFLPTTGTSVMVYDVTSWPDIPGNKTVKQYTIIPREIS